MINDLRRAREFAIAMLLLCASDMGPAQAHAKPLNISNSSADEVVIASSTEAITDSMIDLVSVAVETTLTPVHSSVVRIAAAEESSKSASSTHTPSDAHSESASITGITVKPVSPTTTAEKVTKASEETSTVSNISSDSVTNSPNDEHLSDATSPVNNEAVISSLNPDNRDESSAYSKNNDTSTVSSDSSTVSDEANVSPGNNIDSSVSPRSIDDTFITLTQKVTDSVDRSTNSDDVGSISSTPSVNIESSTSIAAKNNDSDKPPERSVHAKPSSESPIESIAEETSDVTGLTKADSDTTPLKEFNGPSRRKFGASEPLDVLSGVSDSPLAISSSPRSGSYTSGLLESFPSNLDQQSRSAFNQMAEKITSAVALSMDSTQPAEPRYFIPAFEYPYQYSMPSYSPYSFYNYNSQYNPSVSSMYSYGQRSVLNPSDLSRRMSQYQPANNVYKPQEYLNRSNFYSGQQSFVAVPRMGSVDNNKVTSDIKRAFPDFSAHAYPRSRYDPSKKIFGSKINSGRSPGSEGQLFTTARSYNVAYDDGSSVSSTNIDDQLVERIFKRRD